MKFAIFYTLLALIFALLGYFRDSLFYYASIVLSLVAFYWIRKEWKKKN